MKKNKSKPNSAHTFELYMVQMESKVKKMPLKREFLQTSWSYGDAFCSRVNDFLFELNRKITAF